MQHLTTARLHQIQSIPQYQSRATTLDKQVVEEYAELFRQGRNVDPIDVCGSHNLGFFIVDGHHRFAAMKLVGGATDREIQVNVKDARIKAEVVKWEAAGSNVKHGIRRTNADKRRAVEFALQVAAEQSNRMIAEHCGVSDMLVAEIRRQVQVLAPGQNVTPEKTVPEVPQKILPPPPTRRIGKDGKAYPPPPPPPKPRPQTATTVLSKASSVKPPTNPSEEEEGIKRNLEAKTEEVRPRRDMMNRIIPFDLFPHYQRRGEIMSHTAKLKEIAGILKGGISEQDPLYACVSKGDIAHLENLIRVLDNCQPYIVCPWCGGMNDGCRRCGNRGGFISKYDTENFAMKDPEIRKLIVPEDIEEDII